VRLRFFLVALSAMLFGITNIEIYAQVANYGDQNLTLTSSLLSQNTPLSKQQFAQLKLLGVETITYAGNNNYNIFYPSNAKSRLEKIFTLTDILIESKIDTRLLNQTAEGNKEAELMVTLFNANATSQFKAELKEINGIILPTKCIGENNIAIRISASQINKLASLNTVQYLCPLPLKDVALNNVGIAQMNTALSSSATQVGGRNLRGKDITVGVGDDADIQTHIDFKEHLLNFHAGGINNHGSITSGQVAGAGIMQPRYKGMMPDALLISSFFSNILAYTPRFYQDYNMTLTNNSYATVLFDCNNHGVYDALSKAVDEEANDYPTVTHVFAVGNDGNTLCADRPKGFYSIVGQYQTAKNVITVGNLQNNDILNIESSRGPVRFDGRIKPDVVALGTQVQSCGVNDSYTPGWGSSMSSPFTAGAVGLLQQRFKQLNANAEMRSDLAKALILNGATDLGNKGPDYSYGFGRVNVERSMQMIEQNNYRIDSVLNNDSSITGFNITNNNVIMKILLYYHDVAGVPNVYPSLINDLDLYLVSPSGKIHRPFILNFSDTNAILITATTGRDSLNNNEQVQVDYPEIGLWNFVVKAKKITNAIQHFVLAIDTIPTGLKLRYPIGGEHWIAGAAEPIMWDFADTVKQPVTLQYSGNNGATWNTIAANIAATQQQYYWTSSASDSNGFLIRIIASGGQMVTSGKLSCFPLPTVSIGPLNEQCPGYCRITWGSVGGATGYYIYMKKGNKMELVDSVGIANSYVYKNLDTKTKYYFAIRARKGKLTSEQSTAKSYTPNAGNCTLNNYNFDLQAKNVATKTIGRAFTSTSLGNNDSVNIIFTNVDNVKCDSFKVDYNINNSGWQTTGTQLNLLAQTNYALQIPPQNFSAPGTYSIVAAIKNLAKVDASTKNDTIVVEVRQLANDTLNLSVVDYVDDFENLSDTIIAQGVGIKGAERWDFSGSNIANRARSHVMKNFAASGQKALTLDASIIQSTAITNSLTSTFNLSNENALNQDLRLAFTYKHHGQDSAGNADNAVYVRASDTSQWIKCYDLFLNQATQTGIYKNVLDIPLSKILRNANQNFSSSTQIKFTQTGAYKTGDDQTFAGYTFDDVKLFKVYNDVAALALVTPTFNSCKPGANSTVKIKIANYSTQSITNVKAAYKINNGTWVTENIANIPADTIIEYSFTAKANLSASGAYTMACAVQYASDSYKLNDTLSDITVRSFEAITQYPYIQTFEQNDGNFITNGINNSWQYGVPNTTKVPSAASGTKLWKTNLTGKYNDNEYSYLTSPCFEIGALQKPWLAWHMIYDIEDCGSTLCDAAWIEVSGNGKDWIKILPDTILQLNKYLQYYNDSTWKIWKNTDATWHSYGIALPKNLGPSIQFRFVLKSDPGVNLDGVAIDDIHVYDSKTDIVQNTQSVLYQYAQNVQGVNQVNFTSNNEWFASVNPNGATMGNVQATSYLNNGPLRTVNFKYFLDRNYVLQPEINTYANPINTRLYFNDADFAKVIADTICTTCIKPADVTKISVLKYSSVQKEIEDSTLANNTIGGYLNFEATTHHKIPCKDGHFVEVPVTNFSEFWLHYNADTSTESTYVPEITWDAVNNSNLKAKIDWRIGREFNVHHYDVMRAIGNNPSSAAFVQVAKITSTGNGNDKSYNHIDAEPKDNEVYYYQIRTVLNSGEIFTTDIKPVVFGSGLPWLLYPNPILDGAGYVQFQLPQGTKLGLQIVDIAGKLISKQEFTASGNIDKVNIGQEFAAGIYHVTLFNNDRKETFNVLKR
jgi:hypothetical protein